MKFYPLQEDEEKKPLRFYPIESPPPPAAAPAPSMRGISDQMVDDLGGILNPVVDASATKAPKAPAPPPPYKNRLEALDDAVNLLEEGQPFDRVVQSFSGIGIGEGDIIAHGRSRKSPYFAGALTNRRAIEQYTKPEDKPFEPPKNSGSIKPVETSRGEEAMNIVRRGMTQASQTVDGLAFSAGLIDNAGMAELVRKRQREIGKYGPTGDIAAGLERLAAANESGDWGAVASEVVKPENWKALGSIVFESVVASSPQIAALVAGSAVAGPAGAAAAAGASSLAMEFGAAFGETLDKRGVDTSDPVAVRRVLEDPKFQGEVTERGLKRGVPIAVMDAVSAGVAGRFIKAVEGAAQAGKYAQGGARRAFAGAAALEAGAQIGTGMGGEAIAQAMVGESKPLDVLVEGLAEVPSGAVEVASNVASARNLSPAAQIAAEIDRGAEGISSGIIASRMAEPSGPSAADIVSRGWGTTARETSFTPPDSLIAQAGITPVKVPVPGVTEDDIKTVEAEFGLDALRGPNARVPDVPGSDVGGGGAGGSAVTAGGLADSGPVSAGNEPGRGDPRGAVAPGAATEPTRGGAAPDAVAREAQESLETARRQVAAAQAIGDPDTIQIAQRRLTKAEAAVSATQQTTTYGQTTTTVSAPDVRIDWTPGQSTNAQRVAEVTRQFASYARANPRLADQLPQDLRPVAPEVASTFDAISDSVAEALGTSRAVLVESDKMPDGINFAGVSLVNVKGLQKPAVFVAVHENVHQLQDLAERGRRPDATPEQKEAAEIWAPMEETIWSMVPEAERVKYAQRALGMKGQSATEFLATPEGQREVRREMLADFSARRLTEPETVNELARRNPAAFGGFARKMVDYLSKTIKALRGNRRGLGPNDVDRHIADLQKAKAVWQDAMLKWAARGGAKAQPSQGATPSRSGRAQPYGAAPDSLMGYPKDKPAKGFGESRYRHVEYVRVKFDDGAVMAEAMDGLNKAHALERARRNWKDAEIEAMSREEAEALDPGISDAVEAMRFKPSASERIPGESDKQFAKRVIDKRPAPDSLPETYESYFLMDGAKVVPMSSLVSSKTDAENEKGGTNAVKRMAAAAAGELPRRAPITVMPSKTPGKYDIVDGNGTFTSVGKYGWKSLPVLVVSREKGLQMIEEDRAKDAKEAAEKAKPKAALINGEPYDPKRHNFEAPKVKNIFPKDIVTQADELVAKFYLDRPEPDLSAEDRARAEEILRPMMEAAAAQKVAFDQKIIDIAQRTSALGQMLAPIKGMKRAAEKLALDEKFNPEGMKDLLRSTIVVEGYADAKRVVDEIRKEFKVLRIKDRSDHNLLVGEDVKVEPRKKFGGYADVLINVVMPNGTIAEIQINVPQMLSAKGEQGHKLYEAAREQPEGTKLRDRIYSAMEVLYDAAFDLANSRQPAAQARNADSEMGAAPERGMPASRSDSPESSSLKTRPSGNSTSSSPENEAQNREPGGNLSGNFISNSSRDNEIVNQGSLYVSRPLLDAQKLHDWAVKAGIQNVVPPSKMHATVVYSRAPLAYEQLGAAPETVSAITKRLMRLGEDNDIVITLSAPALEARHKQALEKGASWDHDRSYIPHVTLSYSDTTTDITKLTAPNMPVKFGPEKPAPLRDGWATEEGLAPSKSVRLDEDDLLRRRRNDGKPIVDSVVRDIGLTEEELASTSLPLMTGLTKGEAFATNEVGKIPEVVSYLEERRRASGLRPLDLVNEADRAVLAKLVAAEALAAIRSAGSAVEWYDSTIRRTLNTMALKHPELASDQRARDAFLIATAITSQGMNVENNLEAASQQYEAFRRDGRFPVRGWGDSMAVMEKNFALANSLLDELGPDLLGRFLRTPFTVQELNRAGFSVDGELADEMVLGSSVFGPKIGFGFFSNLAGNFEPVTMDMWFMRTIGRLTGNLRAFEENKFAKQLAGFRAAFEERGESGIFADQFDEALVQRAMGDVDAAVELARKVTKAHEKDFKTNRKLYDEKARTKSKLVNAAATIIQSMDKPRDVPASGGERRLLRDVVRQAVGLVARSNGSRVPPAAMQALIWYPEQELYKALGVRLAVTSQDYAGAAEKVLKEQGYGQDEIRAAAEGRLPGGARRVADAADAGFDEAAGQEPQGPRPLEGRERREFLHARVVAETRRSLAAAPLYREGSGGGQKPWVDVGGSRTRPTRTFKIASRANINALQAVGISTPEIHEVDRPDLFALAIQGSKANNPSAASVYVYPVEEYSAMRLFLTSSGKSGFAIKPDGDIVSVFNYDPDNKGVVHAMLPLAVQLGGRKLDAFDTVLPKLYGMHGFRAVARLPWNDEFSPEGWNKQDYRAYNNGEPDVVFMVHDPENFSQYRPGDGQRVGDYDAAVAAQAPSMSRRLEDDLRAQEQFLNERAREAGYRDLEELFDRDPSAFMRAAAEWREMNPAEEGLSASARIPLVSPASVLNAAVTRAAGSLEAVLASGRPKKLALGRTPHVLSMLGAQPRALEMDEAIVRKVFFEKHFGKLDGVDPREVVVGLYRPAAIFKKPGTPNEYELLLPVPTRGGPLFAVIGVDSQRAFVKSIYPRSWNNPESGPGVKKFFSDRGVQSKPVYVDEYLIAAAATGNGEARAEAGFRIGAGSPDDQRPGVNSMVASARPLSPAQTPVGSGNNSIARPGSAVNPDHFISLSALAPLLKKAEGAKSEADLKAWIGENYDGPAGDGPSFSARTGWRDSAGRLQFAPGAAAYRVVAGLANRALEKVKMKPISPELGRAIRKMKVEIERAQNLSIDVSEKLGALSDDERRMISDVIERELKAGVTPPKRILAAAASISRIMSEQTQELIRLGMLDKDTAARLDGKYLPRFYEKDLGDQAKSWAKAAKRLISRPGSMQGIKGNSLKARGIFKDVPVSELQDWVDQGWEERDPGRTPADETVRVWRDFTREEREQMGEIRDASFRFVMGYMRSQKDIALGRLYESLARDVAQKKQPLTGSWVQVPQSPVGDGVLVRRYGKLSGMWVPVEVMDHLSVQDRSFDNELLQAYRKGLSMWKEGKTVLNPVSHVNNVISNIISSHFAGVSMWEAHKYAGAIRDLMKSAPMVQEASDAGLFGGTFSSEELTRNLPDKLKILAQQQESALSRGADKTWTALSLFLRKPAGIAYEAEDKFFRYLIYRDARKRGLNPDEAVEFAQTYVFTYDDLPQGARVIRDTALPFFSYTYKAIPMLAETALKYPWRYAFPAALVYGANAAAYAIAAGADEDDLEDIVRKYFTDEEFRAKAREIEKSEAENLPPWMQGYGMTLGVKKTIRLGMDETTDLPVFLEVQRWIPGGDIFDITANAGGLPLPAPITPSNPLLTLFTGLIGNKDLFTGKDLVDKKADTDAEAGFIRAQWAWRQITPAVAPMNYHWDRALQTIAHATGEPITFGPLDYTGTGRDGLPAQVSYSAMQTFGVKARPIDLELSAEIEKGDVRATIARLDAEMRRVRRLLDKGAKSEESAEKELELLRTKKDRLRDGMDVDGEPRP